MLETNQKKKGEILLDKLIILDTTDKKVFSNSNSLNSKKFDHIKIAYLLNHYGELSANQINFYLTKIFKLSWTNSHRVSALLNSRGHIFEIIQDYRNIKTYDFNGLVILNKTTRHNWNKKIENFQQLN